MLAFQSKHCRGKHIIMNFIIISQIYTTVILRSVNSEKVIETTSTDVALTETAVESSSDIYINSNVSNNDSGTLCGNTQKMADNCFRDLPPHLMEFLQTSKIAIDEKDILSKCNVFRRGMKCFDDYTSRCIPSDNINILNNNVEGAKKFFTKFCEDKAFQKDYLSHKDCFSYIQEDWMHCTKTFQNILVEGLQSEKNITEKFLEFCCARYAYETCIYNIARYKCYQNSAAFARATAQMLSDEKHFSNCRQFEVSTCGSKPVKIQQQNFHWTLWLVTSALFIRRTYHLMS